LKEKSVSVVSLTILVVFGTLAILLAHSGQSVEWRFMLAFFPLLVVLFGVALLRQSGLTMAFVGLILAIALAILEFRTSVYVAVGSAAVGFLKSFPLSISCVATMLMIFLMQETGALPIVSDVIKHSIQGEEARALYIGVGFGSFVTSLGISAPALFPPLLVTMGFSPLSSVAISVLGYSPTTSFSLLSVPITLPADVSKSIIGVAINRFEFAFKISVFLPLISIGFAFALLWLTGGKTAMRRGAVPAAICGVVLGFTSLAIASVDYFTGTEYVPLRVLGIVAGSFAMVSVYIYNKMTTGIAQEENARDHPTRNEILRAFSPWILLTVLAAISSVPQVSSWLSNLPGNLERIPVFADQTVDLDVLSQIYTWIFVAVLLSFFTLKATKKQVKNTFKMLLKRFASPFLSFILYFCLAFVMAYSAMQVVGGNLVQLNLELNMNYVLGVTLAKVFGGGYVFVAASLGLFGAIVGGSETSSNVLFMKVQKTASDVVGLDAAGFMTVYGSHAAAGGIASAVTPAKINNAVATIGESRETESLIMRKNLIIALLLTAATGILTGILVNLGI
jgi:lactate permease